MHSRSRQYPLAIAFLAITVLAGAAVATAAESQTQKVKVFVFAQEDPSGFIDERTGELKDSLKDLEEAIRKKKSKVLQLVTSREQADIALEVTERAIVERGARLATSTTYDKDGKRSTSQTTQIKEHDVVVKAVMHVGDYQNELVGVCDLGYLFGGPYRQAAKSIVGDLEKWAKTNYSRLQLKQ